MILRCPACGEKIEESKAPLKIAYIRYSVTTDKLEAFYQVICPSCNQMQRSKLEQMTMKLPV